MKKLVGFIFVFVIMAVLFNYHGNKNNVLVNYNGNNLKVSIDGVDSDKLPTSGSYYLASYSCHSSNTKVSWDKDTYELSISNGNKRGDVSCYLDFQSNPKLSLMSSGSYVKYVGNNGCSGKHCNGENANYVDSNNMGYCSNSNSKYISNGWRIAYVSDGSAYLVSGGSPECISNAKDLSINALKYCNINYAYNGECNVASTWNINSTDYRMITGNDINSSICLNVSSNKLCGYNNSLIDNGGYYWYSYTVNGYGWNPTNWSITDKINSDMGLRPIIRLDSNVIVIGGNGTYDNPYEISNYNYWVIDANDKSKIKLSLTGYNVSKMCISVDTSVCNNYIDFNKDYILDLSKEETGDKIIYVYYKDNKDRIVASMNRSITIK